MVLHVSQHCDVVHENLGAFFHLAVVLPGIFRNPLQIFGHVLYVAHLVLHFLEAAVVHHS